MNQNHYNWTPS